MLQTAALPFQFKIIMKKNLKTVNREILKLFQGFRRERYVTDFDT